VYYQRINFELDLFMSFTSIAYLIVCYFAGTIPFGLLLSRFVLKTDIRSIGSGNIGATNVLRTGNKKIAIATLLSDLFKGTLPILIFRPYIDNEIVLLIGAFLCVIGHVFPLWLKFKGGKGVATALGTFLALSPAVFLCVTLTWLVAAKVFRISSLSALIAFLLSPLYGYFFSDMDFVMLSSFVTLLLFFTHRSNIKRLLSKEEGKF
jgi:glycerol-3-phosphate acyltransferase PlsY